MEQIKQEITEEDFSINPLVCVVDGAKCLSDLFEEIYKEVKNKVLILDIIHALEYIWLIANANYKESSEEGKKYVYDKLQLILHGKVASYIKKLEDEITPHSLYKFQVFVISCFKLQISSFIKPQPLQYFFLQVRQGCQFSYNSASR